MRKNTTVVTMLVCILAFAQKGNAQQADTTKWAIVDEPPAVLKRVNAVYPKTAEDEKAEGIVWLSVLVDEHGKVGRVEVLKSPRNDLAEAAKEAAMKFEFSPGKDKGQPVAVWVSIPFKFKLQESETKLEFPEGSLTPDQIARALSSLGIFLQPFRYTLPYEHRISLAMDVYRNGKKEATYGGTFLQQANEASLVLTLRNDNGKLTVAVSNANTSRTFPAIDLGSQKAVLYQNLEDVHLAMNKKTAFYIFAANRDAIESIKGGGAEAYIKKYPLVLVVSAELKPKEGK